MKLTSFPGLDSPIKRQVLATVPSCLISICSGMTFGITAVMLPQLRVDETITYVAGHESWIASISSLSMVIGSLSSGHILDRYGRRIAHIILGLPYIIGWIAIAAAPSTAIIILGRVFTGLSSGANKAVMLVYIGEIATPKVRTVALVIPSILLNCGILVSHIYGYYLNWRISSYICLLPSVLISVTSYFLRESPLWLIGKGRTEEGIENFRWFRGTDNGSEVELKLVLERQLERPINAKGAFKVLFSSAFLKPMFTLFVIMINIQFSGASVLAFYSQDIFRETFQGMIDPFIMMVVMDCIVGIVSAASCVLGKYVSKKISYQASNIGVVVFVAGLVACLLIDVERLLWVAVFCLAMFLVFSTGVLTLGWTFVPELLPGSARGLGSGLNSSCAAISLFTIVKVTPNIMNHYGPSTVFAFYAVSALICGLILQFTLRETEGKTLQSIEDSYNNKENGKNVTRL